MQRVRVVMIEKPWLQKEPRKEKATLLRRSVNLTTFLTSPPPVTADLIRSLERMFDNRFLSHVRDKRALSLRQVPAQFIVAVHHCSP